MKRSLQILLLPFIFACRSQESKKSVAIAVEPPKEVRKIISLQFVGFVSYRRSYASIQFMDDEKEIEAYVAKQERSDPIANQPIHDSLLHKRFQQLGWANGNELSLKKFPVKKKKSFSFINSAANKVNVKSDADFLKSHRYWLKAFANGDSAMTDTYDTIQPLEYAFVDVIAGGNKEIVMLSKYHIMNGDNFDLVVYEIQTGK